MVVCFTMSVVANGYPTNAALTSKLLSHSLPLSLSLPVTIMSRPCGQQKKHGRNYERNQGIERRVEAVDFLTTRIQAIPLQTFPSLLTHPR